MCRMKDIMRRLVLVAMLVSALAPALAGAHERKDVGPYRLVIGWGDEPAFSGLKNAVEVDVADLQGQPVAEGATLSVDVAFGDQHMPLPLRPVRAVPGKYRAVLLPTRAGTYAFHITGNVKEQAVDVTSTCSSTTFACIADLATIQFPAKDPSAGELAERMTRELTRAGTAAATAGAIRTISIAALAIAVVCFVVVVRLLRRAGSARG